MYRYDPLLTTSLFICILFGGSQCNMMMASDPSIAPPSAHNSDFELAINSLEEINSESDKSIQRDKAIILGTLLSNNSIDLSEQIKSQIYHILANITYVGNKNMTTNMIQNLYTSYQEEINSIPKMNYTELRMLETDEQRLLRNLMVNYEKSVRPVMKASDLVDLKIGLTLNQIDVDEKNQVLTVLVWLDQEWYDAKMLWDPADYSNLTVLRIPCHKLWLPDIVLYNSVEDMKEGYMQALAMVSYDGIVFWPPIVKFRGACEIRIKYFPYDDQVCKLKLGTWAYDGHQVNLSKRLDGMDMSNYQSNGEWILLRTTAVRNEIHYPCCEAPFLDVTFHVYLRRRTLYYTHNIVIPCVVLSILTLLSFWMRPDCGEKISLGLTILLAFSVFMLLIAESMPSTSVQVPIIGIYITLSMCITALSVSVAVLVAGINHQAETDHQVPKWLHKVCYALSTITCMKMVSWEERHFNIKKLALNSQLIFPGAKKKGNIEANNLPKNIRSRSPAVQIGLDDQQETKKLVEVENGTGPGSGHVTRSAGAGSGGSGRSGTIDAAGGLAAGGSGGGGLLESKDPLLARLHHIIAHQEDLLRKQNSSEDWHVVAIIIDRCLFWIYLLVMLSITIGCLVIFPLAKETITMTEDDILY